MTKDRKGIKRLSSHPRGKSALLPEVVATGDVILGKWCVQSCKRVPWYTVFNVQVQVTLPLNVYSYFSTLKEKGDEKRGSP